MSVSVHHGDCLDVMPRLDPVDAIVCDPPYGLEFMGKEWDRFAPPRTKYHGERADTRKSIGGDDSKPASRHHVAFNMGRPTFRRCTLCGKREFSGSKCQCEAPQWVLEQPEGTPTRMAALQTWAEAWARAAFTLLPPGGYLVAFGGTRTHHRVWCAIEDAGFEIRDTLSWMYGSGFPKSRALLKPAWEPICLARKPGPLRHLAIDACRIGDEERVASFTSLAPCKGNRLGAAGTAEARRGTQGEPKTYIGRWPANCVHDGSAEVLEAFARFGERRVSGNVNPTRQPVGYMGGAERAAVPINHADEGTAARFFFSAPHTEDDEWTRDPASFADGCSNLSSEAVASALSRAAAASMPGSALIAGTFMAPATSATASELRLVFEIATETIRNFARRCSLGSPPERLSLTLNHAACVAERKPTGIITITISRWKSNGSAGDVTFAITSPTSVAGGRAYERFHFSGKADEDDRAGSSHPTVKPVSLMRWLCRLVTPPHGTVLDPFAGSGTTGVACVREGFNAVLIEREAEYVADIRRRIDRLSGADTPLFRHCR